MSEIKKGLSKYKEVNCSNCYEPMILFLDERRGEKNILCPYCKKEYTIGEIETFMYSLSPILEGKCPNCETKLIFSTSDRVSDKKIKCPECLQFFYIEEVLEPKDYRKNYTPVKPHTLKSKSLSHPEILLKNYKTYILLSIFLDFLFIFTFLSISEKNKIEKEVDNWSEDNKITFNTWHTTFKVLLIIKIVLIVIYAINQFNSY